MRQFDVFIWGSASTGIAAPPWTDPALGWFFVNHLNDRLNDSDAEWIVFAEDTRSITRDFLNSLAEAIGSFPMIDAFAPRLRHTNGTTSHFDSGFRIQASEGFQMISEEAALCYVAAPHPELAAFSRRIIQRTGRFDESLPKPLQIVDYALRMHHAGGKMFNLPYLVAEGSGRSPRFSQDDVAFTLFKSFGFAHCWKFILRHPGVIASLWKRRHELETKRDAAILLSKLDWKFYRQNLLI